MQRRFEPEEDQCVCHMCRPDMYKHVTQPIIELAQASTEP